MLSYKPNPEMQDCRIHRALHSFETTGDVLWDGSRAVYTWLGINLPMTATVLDIGCGTGFGTHMLTPRNVVGIDKSAEGIRFAKSVYPRMTFEQWDIALSMYPRLVDVVLMLEVIEHIEDWPMALEHAKMSAAKLVIVSTPNRHAACVPDDHPSCLRHVREFTPEELITAFGEGWSVQQYGYTRVGDNPPQATFVQVMDLGGCTPFMLIGRRTS